MRKQHTDIPSLIHPRYDPAIRHWNKSNSTPFKQNYALATYNMIQGTMNVEDSFHVWVGNVGSRKVLTHQTVRHYGGGE